MFENYCDRATLKSMCPTFCNQKCKKLTTNLVATTPATTTSTFMTTTTTTSTTTKTTITTTSTTTTTTLEAKTKFKLITRKTTSKEIAFTTISSILDLLNVTQSQNNTHILENTLKYFLFIPSNQTLDESLKKATTKNSSKFMNSLS